ncbi:uncharacterized protein LOC106879343 [Octopus bimaculoides]|uniref:uncharacterized protein LOC106879343 n=1 Tax=Octopus bimaculoides TaxID=37653 RepID=UPI00071E396F|nr:uncharacterized protein LOC106879343 [Octopus bimaculoides]|eukprot:XP_014784340.1 PREDICTED: uncharacterized protein LOC106879343 [Octopus bimaculoides]
MTSDMSYVLFTDGTRVTLDGPDGRANGWVYFGDHQRLRCQQQGGGVMLWTGIIGDRLVGSVRMPEGVNVMAVAYYNLLKEVLDLWLDNMLLSLLRNLIFMHDNAPAHSAGTTQRLLGLTAYKVKG